MAAIAYDHEFGIWDLAMQRPPALDRYHPIAFAPDDERWPPDQVCVLLEAVGVPVSRGSEDRMMGVRGDEGPAYRLDTLVGDQVTVYLSDGATHPLSKKEF